MNDEESGVVQLPRPRQFPVSDLLCQNLQRWILCPINHLSTRWCVLHKQKIQLEPEQEECEDFEGHCSLHIDLP